MHFIGTGGGITARGQWVEAHPKFLVPVLALSLVFRARFHDALRDQYPGIFATIKPKVWWQPVHPFDYYVALSQESYLTQGLPREIIPSLWGTTQQRE